MTKWLVAFLLVVSLGAFVGGGLFTERAFAQTDSLQTMVRAELVRLINRLVSLLRERLAVLQETDREVDVPEETSSPPVISAVSPSSGTFGMMVEISGNGFSKTDNTIYTGYGKTKATSPDGQTLSLTINPPFPRELGRLKTASFPEIRLRIYVENENGRTEIPGGFVFNF